MAETEWESLMTYDECSINTAFWAIKIKREITVASIVVNFLHRTSTVFNTISKHINAIMSSCHEFTLQKSDPYIGNNSRTATSTSSFLPSRQHPHRFFSAQTKDLSRGVNFQQDNSTPNTLEISEHPSYCLNS
jgi:hypothetical protein